MSIFCPFFALPPVIVCTNSILRDITSELLDSTFTVVSIVPPGSDPHIYSATPADVRLLSHADLVIINGLRLEGWLEKLITNSGYSGEIIVASTGITPLLTGGNQTNIDPHAWMQPMNGIKYAQHIASGLSRHFPSEETNISIRLAAYIDQLNALHLQISEGINNIPEEQKILITTHDSFRYFALLYGLRPVPLMGISTEADLQVRDILRISRILSEKKVPAIFSESTINPHLLYQVARDFNVCVSPPLFTDSLSDKEGPVPTYLGLLKYNADIIIQYLSGDCMDKTRTGALATIANTNLLSITSILGIIVLLIFSFLILVFKLNRKH